MTYYPAGPVQPGYRYRVKALLFESGGNYTYDSLVSIGMSGSYALNYAESSATYWNSYSYDSEGSLFGETNISVSNNKASKSDADNHTISMKISSIYSSKATQYNLLDNYYYIRLAKKVGNSWEIVSDPKYYGTTTVGYPSNTSMKICYKAFAINTKSFDLTFENLDPDTEYRVQFYGLADTDYDNYLDLSDGSTPFSVKGESVFTLGSQGKYPTESTSSTATNRYTQLYQTYLGISGYKSVTKYNTASDDFLTKANYTKALIGYTSSATTLSKNTMVTLGSLGEIDANTDGQFVITFKNTSGLGHITKCTFEFIYESLDGTTSDESTGEITIEKGNKESIMDSEKTSGDVSLTVKRDDIELMNWSRYRKSGYYKLTLTFWDGNEQVKKFDGDDIQFD
jgi:hypothetical protein